MSTPTSTSEYLLLFRRTDWDRNLSPEEAQKVIGKFMGWMERLTKEGKFKGGQPLENEGRVVTGKNGRNVADGPFAESKEAIGGYFLLTVDSLEEAVEIAQQNPLLEHGLIVEVRPVAKQCATMKRLGVEYATAVA